MKIRWTGPTVLNVMFSVLILGSISLRAGTTVNPTNKYAYGANIGWLDFSGGAGQTASGAVIGAYVCSGYIYSANVGWINLGNGSPTNGIYYQNLSWNDFGVNQDGLGNLRGYAYGANIGWINFASNGAPTVDMVTGRMHGSVWSANCGWISLSNATAYVQTDTISPGALDTNGLPAAWELMYFGRTGLNPNADPTGKGMTIAQDYLAGTNPNSASSLLAIMHESFSPKGTNITMTWETVPTRYYYIEEAASLGPTNWTTNSMGLISPQGSNTTVTFKETGAAVRFYQIQAVTPLVPH
jgi:hypothetical protein